MQFSDAEYDPIRALKLQDRIIPDYSEEVPQLRGFLHLVFNRAPGK